MTDDLSVRTKYDNDISQRVCKGIQCSQLLLMRFTVLLVLPTSLRKSKDSCNGLTDPIVTLRHGGKLLGRRFKVNGAVIDQFVSIRYAKPPIGERRFKKPEPVEPWIGVENTTRSKNICAQKHRSELIGDEDCLFLDIVVPGGVGKTKKPVMVWIHGGGYYAGNGMSYIGTPLALHGDVIVVSINYRLGIFGFLADVASGSGNFGLWDQRAAIVWVKENIGEFGGDSEMITIFGESAGGSSVAAQMMGQHNDNLFKRGIAQSGSLYLDILWNLSLQDRHNFKKTLDCNPSTSIYDCVGDKTAQELLAIQPLEHKLNMWHPVPDNAFFPNNIEDQTYDLSKRFDLLAGFNGQEGSFLMSAFVSKSLSTMNVSLDECCHVDIIRQYLILGCKAYMADIAAKHCADFIINLYELDGVADKRQVAIRLSYFLGDLHFNTDIVHLLEMHSTAFPVATYAYYFTEPVKPPEWLTPYAVPDWLKISADHGDELPFVFGSTRITDDMLEPIQGREDINEPMMAYVNYAKTYIDETYNGFTDSVMTMWTNFAKTGNPNSPVNLDPTIPDWPMFHVKDEKFLQLSRKINVITTPSKERLKILRDTFISRNGEKGTDDSRPAQVRDVDEL